MIFEVLSILPTRLIKNLRRDIYVTQYCVEMEYKVHGLKVQGSWTYCPKKGKKFGLLVQ